MKLRRVRVRMFKGIEELDVSIPEAGTLVKGGNARGKSSFLDAVKTCLGILDLKDDAIRVGASGTELFIDTDVVEAKRSLKRGAKPTLLVGRDGMKASKPATHLKDLLGTSSLDPLDLFLGDAKSRRAKILAALPITVTREQIAKYAPEAELPLDFTTEGHGLEVVERARKFFYDERTVANKEAADAKREADRLSEEATALARAVTPGPVLAVDAAKAAVAAAERELAAVEGRAETAAAAHLRTAGHRQRVEALRAEAADEVKSAGELTATQALEQQLEEASESVRVLEQQLASSRAALVHLTAQLVQAKTDNDRHARAKGRAADLRTRADEILATLAEAAIVAPTTAEIEAADGRLGAARAARERAEQQAKAISAVDVAESARKAAKELEAEASELDATVKRLTHDAPSELLAAADGIQGLTLDGDEVLLDGVRLTSLSSAEQLKVSVEIARRANAHTKILVVDGLERLDEDQLERFVAHATRGGWQLLGTLVTKGDLEFVAIEPTETAAAAE